MLERIKKWWLERRKRRALERQLAPEAFRRLAGEVGELAGWAQRLFPRQHKMYQRIKTIQSEMDQLSVLASQPEFRRLSPDKRLALRQSLAKSREQLLETVRNAPSPTTTLQ